MAFRPVLLVAAVLLGLLLLAPAVASAGGRGGAGQDAGNGMAWTGPPGVDAATWTHADRAGIDPSASGAPRPDPAVSPAPARTDAVPAGAAAGRSRSGAARGGERPPADAHGGRHRGPAPSDPVPYAAPTRPADEPNGSPPGAAGARGRKEMLHPPGPVPEGAGAPDPVLLLRFLLVLGFRRVRPGNVLEHPVRVSLHAAIRLEPGLDLAGCATRTGANRETLRYHLALLVCCGKVVEEARSGSVRYFPPDPALTPVHRALVHARNNRSRAPLLAAIRDRPGIARHELAETLGIAGPSVTRQVQRLVADGLVIAERDGRAARYRLTAECLSALGPAVPADPPATAAREGARA